MKIPLGWAGFLLCLVAGLSLRAETVRYSAVVIDSSQKPVSGAMVEVYHSSDTKPYIELVTNLNTDAEGRFGVVLPEGSVWALARKSGAAPIWGQLSKTNTVRLALFPPTTLAGMVVDETGKAVVDAEIFVSIAHTGDAADWNAFLWGEAMHKLFSSRSDASGRFRIDNFPPNSRAELDVRFPGKVLPPRQVQYSPKSLLCGSGDQNIRLVLERQVEITGRVITDTGETLANARVRLRSPGAGFGVPWESEQGVTNSVFRFTGVSSGSYLVDGLFGTNALPDWVAEPASVVVKAGQNADVELKATKGGVVQVRSLDKRTGKPIQDVSFSVRVGSDYVHATSDANGLGQFRLIPGRYQVTGSEWNHSMGYRETEAQAEVGQTNEVTLEFSAPPTIAGVIRDPSGKAAAGINLWLHPMWPRVERKTDANGRWEVVHTETPQVIVAVDTNRHLAVSRELDNENTNLDLQLGPALTITGRVEGSEDKPISEAHLMVYLKSGDWGLPVEWQPVKTDAQGNYKITDLPADRRYYVIYNAQGYGSAQQNVPDNVGNQIALPATVLKRATLKLVGKVVDAAGAPMAMANVSVNGYNQPDRNLLTDSQGRFELETVEGQRASLTVFFQDLQTSVTTQAGETNVVVVLKPKTSNDSDGQPPKRASLVDRLMPSLKTANFESNAVSAGKPVLICLFESEQRSSRRAIRVLGEQYESLRQKGITVLGVQANVVADDAFDHWKQENPAPFPIGRITEKRDATLWATGTELLPWLILVNSQGRVVAEGFSLEELPGKIPSVEK